LHGARLSKNACKRSDLFEHRIATLRLYGIGKEDAYEKKKKFVHDVESHAITIVKMENEYAVFDTNVEMDSGWI